MQIQAVNINKNQPTFGEIKIQNGVLENKKRKAISDHIAEKLNEVNPNDKSKRSYVQKAEKGGYNIWFTKGEKRNSVRVDVVSTLAERKAAVWNGLPIRYDTHVGTYTKPEQFKIDHFNAIYNDKEKEIRELGYYIYGTLAAVVLAVGILLGINNKMDIQKRNANNVEVVTKDSIKTESIKPIIEDTVKLGKKALK